MFYDTISNYSNINHTCPYDVSKANKPHTYDYISMNMLTFLQHDIIIDKMWTGDIDRELSKLIPMPPGDYAVYLNVYSYKKLIAEVQFFGKVTNNN